MSNPPWFYHSFEEVKEQVIEIVGQEANHIMGARRLRIGDALTVMNGHGKLVHCELAEASQKARVVRLNVLGIAEMTPPERQIVLATALPKGDRLSILLDMACQLGMTHFQPLVFYHSVSNWHDKLKARCERIVVQAAKQSQSAWLPQINDAISFENLVQSSFDDCGLYFVADQAGQSWQCYESAAKSATRITLIVGPEAGLSVFEMKSIKEAGIMQLKLAKSILRIETAAVSALATLNQIR